MKIGCVEKGAFVVFTHASNSRAIGIFAVFAIFLLCSINSFATNFTVNNTSDGGAGSLRFALQMSAATSGPHTISFNIPQSDPNFDSETGVWKITPATTYDYIIKSNVTIDGTSQTTNQGNTNLYGPEIYLDGNSQAINFCFSIINASNTVIKGFAIGGFMYGIQVFGTSSLNAVISGNYIGTNETADDVNGNFIGIEILTGANNTTIGGINPEDKNVISGNEHIGIRLLDVRYCNVFGNFVGVNRIGTEAIPNYDGISLEGAAKFNNIGGNTIAHRNLVSGNVAYGIPVFGAGAEGNVISGNLIGTDITGTFAIPNTYGVLFDDGSYNNILGGDTDAERNVLSGNSGYGVFIYNMGTNSNIIRGNFIGTNKSGESAIPNAVGIVIDGAAFKHIIDNNIISGNLQQGIYINITGCDSTKIVRNKIGLNVNDEPLGNGSDGIRISQGPKYSIIGGSVEEANQIAYNTGNGVYIMFDNDDNHLISCNAIYLNNGLGIDLFPPGVNANDTGDVDAGANDGMNFPEISDVSFAWGSGETSIVGTLDSPNPELCEIQIFKAIPNESGHGQALQYLASVTPNSEGLWTATIPIGVLDAEDFITALAIDADNNTSEFSITRSSVTIASLPCEKLESGSYIYPNPTADHFRIFGETPDCIEVFDSNGSVVFLSTPKNNLDYDISELKSGIYFVKFVANNFIQTHKLIIIK